VPVLIPARTGQAAPPRTGAPARVVLALARFEGRKLVESPIFLVGFALALGACFVGWSGDSAAVLERDDVELALFLTLLAWGTLLAANLAATRARRDRTTELLASLPAAAETRTAAQALAATTTLPLSAAILAAWWAYGQLRYPATIGTPRPGELAVGPLLVLGGGAAGVLVARWLPTVLAGPAAVVATVVLQLNWGAEDHRWRWLHFVAWEPVTVDPWLEVRPAGWHLTYLLGLVVLAGALAVARHGLRRPLAAVLAGAVAVVLVSGWAQTRPPSAGQVAAIVDRLERPEAHQLCQRHGQVRYCFYPTYRDWVDQWRGPIEGVLAQLPVAARGRELLVRQRVPPSTVAALHPEVRARLAPARVWRADGALHPGLGWYTPGNPAVVLPLQRAELSLAYQAAAWAVGLPPAATWPPAACDAGGQARTVAALWLAGAATPGAGRALRWRAAEVERGGPAALAGPAPVDFEPRGPDEWQGLVAEPGSTGRGADLVAAARLLDVPPDRVAGALTARWDRLTAPATPAGELLGPLGMAAAAVGSGGKGTPCP
jgi:hypothetical protein